MPEYVYVGKRRRRGWMFVWQILTLGVYGRVYLYKVLREADGHEALFMDRRWYLPLLLLPFGGPFWVKRRIAYILEDLLHHDVTGAHYSRRRMVLLGLIPLAPVFHVQVQGLLNHHWKMHTKAEELRIKEAQLAALKRRARSPESQREAADLEKDVALRAKELDDLQKAALALREAEAARREAERAAGANLGRRGPLAMVRKLIPVSGKRSAVLSPDEGEVDSEPEPTPRARGRARPPEPEPEPVSEEAPAPHEAPGSIEESPGERKGLLGFLRRPKPEAADEAPKPSRAERKRLKREAKEARRRQKEEAKAAKREEKARRKQANAEKAEAASEKAGTPAARKKGPKTSSAPKKPGRKT